MCRNIRTLYPVDRAVAEVAHPAHHLPDALVTTATPKNRDEMAAKPRARAARRSGPSPSVTSVLPPRYPLRLPAY